jgi:hypothetical protein
VETPLNQTGAVGFGCHMCAQGSPEMAIAQTQRVLHYCRFSDAGLWDEVAGNATKLNGSGGDLALNACAKVPREGEGPSAGDPALSSIFGCWAAR